MQNPHENRFRQNLKNFISFTQSYLLAEIVNPKVNILQYQTWEKTSKVKNNKIYLKVFNHLLNTTIIYQKYIKNNNVLYLTQI